MTVMAMASAGKSVVHQIPAIMLVYSSEIWRPQSGDGGWMPTPRKDSVATVKIGIPEADRQLDHDRALDVREDLADHDEQARLPAQLGRGDVVELALGQDRRADGAGHDRREQDARRRR